MLEATPTNLVVIGVITILLGIFIIHTGLTMPMK